MIRISKQTDYAIRVLLALARRVAGSKVSSAEIQREMLIPPAFASRIIARLGRQGLIDTLPGRDGGIRLARPAEEISLKDVVTAFETPLALSECLLEEADCPFAADCPVRRRWAGLQAMFLQALDQIKFSDLAAEVKA